MITYTKHSMPDIWYGDATDLLRIAVPAHNEERWLSYVAHLVGNEDWIGGDVQSIDDCIYGRKTWHCTKEVIELSQNIKVPRLASIKRVPTISKKLGTSLKVSSLFSGELRWRSTKRESSKNLTRGGKVSILVDLSSNASVSAKRYIHRGIACLALTKALQIAGRRVAVYAYDSTKRFCKLGYGYSDDALVTLLKVKGFADPINYRLASVLLTHPGVYRFYFFKAIYSHKGEVADAGHVLGWNEEYIQKFVKENDIIKIPQLFSRNEIDTFLSRMIERLGT